ncbi:unnamed protein product [Clonostachys rosea]|uniref:MAGE domain-containing protein n=1 Tax=Bionectria ochroleuca TaxID=29856 RepID=A0ABY6USM6_BIOOC|nr:unnamed protein product [Clonostachys rosea]
MSSTQRRRRTRDHRDDPEEQERPRQRMNRNDPGSDSDASSQDDMDMDAPSATQDAEEQLVKKLVRYALSCEYSRTPIKRDGIKERVLGNEGRSFRRIYALAQKQLQEVWGMELRELPLREKLSLHEKRKAMSSASQAKAGSGTYVLSSILPSEFRSASILPPSKSPSSDDEATFIAFSTLVVSCIWLSGGELSDQKLNRYLTRLNADQNVSTEKTEAVLKRMEKQNYVVKRVDRPPVGQDGEHSITWHIGPRAKDEIGLDGVMGMTREVYGDTEPELEKKLRASLGIKQSGADAVAEEEAGEPSTSRRESGAVMN